MQDAVLEQLLLTKFSSICGEHFRENVPINSGVPLRAVILTPGTSSCAKPKSISLISQLFLLTHTIFSGCGKSKKKEKEGFGSVYLLLNYQYKT